MKANAAEVVSMERLKEIITEAHAALCRNELKSVTQYFDYGWRGVIIEDKTGKRSEYAAVDGERRAPRIVSL